MTNEELAILIQQGETERLNELWAQVERLAAWWSSRYARRRAAMGTDTNEQDTFDDIYNGCAYPAMCEAVKTFDPGNGGSFATWYYYYFQSEVAELYGYRSSKQDAFIFAKSLNQPLGDSLEDVELEDMIPDPNDYYEDVERIVMVGQLHEALDAALDDLPGIGGEVLRQRYYKGMTQKEIGLQMGKHHSYISEVERKAYRQIKCGQHVQKLYHFLCPDGEYRAAGLRGTGLSVFRNTGSSATENAALKIIDRKERRAKAAEEYYRQNSAQLEQDMEEARAAIEDFDKKLRAFIEGRALE